jgi:HEAT repeat protein
VTLRHLTARRLIYLLTAACMTLSGSGCASFWDEVFSRERDLNGYFRPPNPLVVIHDSTDGERRAQAMAALREPAQRGGNQHDQDTYIEILTTAARNDRDPYCRLGAIQALGHFKDPRAAKALEEAFQAKQPFTQDFNAMIRQTALRSLEKIGSEASCQMLILVARQPGPTQDAASIDRQQTQDEKLIAIRALGQYHQPECIETLVYILESERDVALRDRAHQSLRSATGKNLPAEPEVWRAALAGQPVNELQPNLIERVSEWLK